MKVIQVSPAFFGADGVVGGGERYPLELAKALATLTPTTLISFARQPRRFRDGDLDVRLYRPWRYVRGKQTNPFSLAWLPAVLGAGVVHVHQYRTAAANLGIGAGCLLRKRVYVTDEGGGGHHWGNRLRLGPRVAAHLAISQFAATTLPEVGKEKLVIYGGVDTSRYVPAESTVPNRVLSVGRILPHKGFDVLLRAARPHWDVHVVGTVYHQEYFAHLRRLADERDLNVTFHTGADDATLIGLYQSAAVVATPSVYTDMYGKEQPFTELLGLTTLEAMACGVPVVVSSAGSLPEIVTPGETGYVVPPGDPAALQKAVEQILADSDARNRLGANARALVEARFTWHKTALRCLEIYQRGTNQARDSASDTPSPRGDFCETPSPLTGEGRDGGEDD